MWFLRYQRGFTVFEILIAGVILTGVAVGVLQAFTSVQKLAVPMIDKSVQTNIGRGKLEDLYESVRQDQWDSTSNALYPGTYTASISGHSTTYVVSTVTGTGSPDYRKVEITVS